jgi:hypothetical protein
MAAKRQTTCPEASATNGRNRCKVDLEWDERKTAGSCGDLDAHKPRPRRHQVSGPAALLVALIGWSAGAK